MPTCTSVEPCLHCPRRRRERHILPWGQEVTIQPVLGQGPTNPELIVIGEGPGRHENDRQIPFVGRAGDLTNRALSLAGTSRKRIWIGNVTCCIPDQAIDAPWARDCVTKHLVGQLEALPGHVPVVLLGRWAMEALTPFRKITEKTGTGYLGRLCKWVWKNKKLKDGSLEPKQVREEFGEVRPIWFVIHPAAILRGSGSEGQLVEVFKRALHEEPTEQSGLQKVETVDAVPMDLQPTGPVPFTGPNVPPTAPLRPATLADVPGALREAIQGIVAIDTETDGLHPWNGHRPFLMQAAWFDAQGPHIEMLDVRVESNRKKAQKIIDHAKRIVGHHVVFDANMLRAIGVHLPWSRVDDTMLLAHCNDDRDSGHGNSGLEKLGVKYICHDAMRFKDLVEVYKQKDTDVRTGKYINLPPWLGYQYSANDVVLTLALYAHFKSKRAEIPKYVYALEQKLLPIFARIESTGIYIKPERLDAARRTFGFRHRQALSALWRVFGYEFNPASTLQIVEAMARIGKKSGKATQKGNDSWDEEALTFWGGEHGAAVIRERQLRVLKSRYLDGLLEHIGPRNRLYYSIRQVGTVTGRSSTQPNMQNIPDDDAHVFRGLFGPEPGRVLLSFDLKTIEPRIMAALSDEKNILDVLNADLNADPYDVMLRRLAAISPAWQWKNEADYTEKRKIIKRAWLALSYGAGEDKYAMLVGLPKPEAIAVRQEFKQGFPNLAAFADESKAYYGRFGYVETWLGRRRHIGEEEGAHKAANSRVQGGAADLFKGCLLRVSAICKTHGAEIVNQVHDDVIVECPLETEAAFVRDTIPAMTEGWPFDVPILVDVKRSESSWGEMEKVELHG